MPCGEDVHLDLRQRSDRRSEDDGIAGVIWLESVSIASPAGFRENLWSLSRTTICRACSDAPPRSRRDQQLAIPTGCPSLVSDEAIGRIARCVRNYLNIASGFDRNQ